MEPVEEKKSNNSKWVYIAVIVVLVVINVIQYFINQHQVVKVVTEAETIIEIKDTRNKSLVTSLDSMHTQLKLRYDEIAKLGGDTALLLAQLRKIEKEKKYYISQASIGKSVDEKKIRAQLEELKTYLSEKDSDIEKLKAERESLFKETTSLKEEKGRLEDSIMKEAAKGDLIAKRLQKAAVLKAEDFKISVINKKGKEEIKEHYKASHIDLLVVNFKCAENNAATIETKTFYLRVMGPDGAPIYDESMGGGTTKLENGTSINYTAKQDILFDNKHTPVSFKFRKGNEYKSGRYTTDIFVEGVKIGDAYFLVK